MSRGPLILFALVAGAVALVLGSGALFGPSEPRGERSALGPSAGDDGGALAPARAAPELQDLVPAPGASSARDARAEAPLVRPERAAAELSLEVLDAVTGRPVPAFFATVLPQGLHAQGRDGAVRFTGLAAGTLTIQVQGPEHEPTVTAAELPAAGPVQVRLTQRTGLRGIVRFADARPAPDVVLRLEASPDTPQAASDRAPTTTAARELAQPSLAKSDAEGRYRFAPLTPGRYTVVGEHLGRVLTTLGPVDVTAGMTELPEVRLDAGARLEVEVTDSAGLPRGDVLLVVVPAEGNALRRYSDREGKLILEPLVAGRYTLTLPAQGTSAEQRRELELGLGVHRESFRVDASPAAGR